MTPYEPRTAHVPEATLPQGLRVLIVDDEVIIAMMLGDMLSDLGCAVIGPVGTEADALAKVAAEPIDMALLDVNLGRGQSGYRVARALADREVPFAFVTGYGTLSLDAEFRGRRTLQKPFRLSALIEVLKDGALEPTESSVSSLRPVRNILTFVP